MFRTILRNTQSPCRIDTVPTFERQSQSWSGSRGREPLPPAESTLPSDPVLSPPQAMCVPRLVAHVVQPLVQYRLPNSHIDQWSIAVADPGISIPGVAIPAR